MSRHELDARKDADILEALGGMGQPRVGERSDAELVGSAMAALTDPRYAPAEPPPLPVPVAVDAPSRAPVVIAVATAALAIAAAVALVVLRPAGLLGESTADSAGSLAPDVLDSDSEAFEAVPGQAKKSGKRKRQVAPDPSAIADETPELPPNCQALAPGVRVCKDEGAMIAAAAGSGSVKLERGKITVSSTPDGKPVIVRAGLVTITGRGTVFEATVKRQQDGGADVVIVYVTSGAVTVTREGQEPTRVGIGDPFVVGIGDDDTEVAPAPADKEPRPSRRKETPNDLLTRAQKLFGAGKTPQAVKVYETLVSRHGSTAAGKAARVSLGRIELNRGKAKQALAHFDAYLAASAGSLVEEARYGRIRALRKLGRTSQELRSIDAFLADYGKSIYAARLTRRAAELNGK